MVYESQEARGVRMDFGAIVGAVAKRLPRIVGVTLILVAATFVLTLLMPRQFESTATILVEPRSALAAPGDPVPALNGGETAALASQLDLIRSRDALMAVIDQLDLRSVPEFASSGGGFSPFAVIGQIFGGAAAPVSVDEVVLGNLNERLTIIQERDLRFISVVARSTDPKLAADIANAVANGHVQGNGQLALPGGDDASDAVRAEIATIRSTLRQAETALADFKASNAAGAVPAIDPQVAQLTQQVRAAQAREADALARSVLIRQMIDRGQPIDGIDDVRNSAIIQQLSQEMARLQTEKAQKSVTLLDNHPTMRTLTDQIADIETQIRFEGGRIAAALEAEAQIAAESEAALNAELARIGAMPSAEAAGADVLVGLERDVASQQALLDAAMQRAGAVSSASAASASPLDMRVVSVAAPSSTPVSPDTQQILIAVGAASILAQIGLVVLSELVAGRGHVASPVPSERPQDELDEAPFVAGELEAEALWDDVDPVAEPAPVLSLVEPVAAVAYDDDLAAFEGDDVVAAAIPVMTEPVAQAPVARRTRVSGMVDFETLTSDLVLGRTQLVILAAHDSNLACEVLAEQLVGDALSRGLSVALVDAGSGRETEEPGMTDLSAEDASFGDVVHKSADNSFAEVPWGQGRRIVQRSTRPLTLVEALGDIYEVVVLMTGPVNAKSSLPMFDSLEGRLVLVADEDDDIEEVAETRQQLIEDGFGRVEIASASSRVAA